jgi:NADH dehydrogenase
MARFVVTGAFGYSGRYIAARLLDRGHAVRTLTNSPDRPNPFGGRVTASKLDFDHRGTLVEALRGADALVNTYWVRFNHRDFTHSRAVSNTLELFDAAREAGVPRVVHISITNPSEDSSLEYFRGKARLERELRESGLSYCILRPAVLFGGEDILVNNIAWVLRRFPVFGVFGDGLYGIQPIHVEDLAELAVSQAEQAENATIDAIGPESFTFRGLVERIAEIIGKPRPIVRISPGMGRLVAFVIGRLVGDVLLTREEIDGLMQGLLCVSSEPAGRTRLTDWARQSADTLGVRYASELARRRDRGRAYGDL